MKCQILFSGKNKKNISKCCLLKILPGVLSVNKPTVHILPVFVTLSWLQVSCFLFSTEKDRFFLLLYDGASN